MRESSKRASRAGPEKSADEESWDEGRDEGRDEASATGLGSCVTVIAIGYALLRGWSRWFSPPSSWPVWG